MNDYFYIIGENLQLYKIKGETMRKLFEFAISPLAIKYQMNNKTTKELFATLEKELKENRKRV